MGGFCQVKLLCVKLFTLNIAFVSKDLHLQIKHYLCEPFCSEHLKGFKPPF